MYVEFNNVTLFAVLYTLFLNCVKDVSKVTVQPTILEWEIHPVRLFGKDPSSILRVRRKFDFRSTEVDYSRIPPSNWYSRDFRSAFSIIFDPHTLTNLVLDQTEQT